MSNGMPGPGGSLGQCALCGDTFARESVIGDRFVHVIEMKGIEGQLYLHESCLKELTAIRGTSWKNLRDGPLRRACEQAQVLVNE